MNELNAQAPPVPWWTAGILLGLVQVLAIALAQPLDVSNQFVVADAKTLQRVAPEYAQNHPLIQALQKTEKTQGRGRMTENRGRPTANGNPASESGLGTSGWWFGIGLVLGAFLAALHLRTWKLRANTAWWCRNHNNSAILCLITGFCGGLCALLGAGLAYGGVVGQSGTGLAQLAVSAVPFTVAALGFGMLVAYLVYPKAPN
jgi:uncharacterized protein